VRGNDANQFPRRNDLCFFPELWEMMLAAGDKIIRAGGIISQSSGKKQRSLRLGN